MLTKKYSGIRLYREQSDDYRNGYYRSSISRQLPGADVGKKFEFDKKMNPFPNGLPDSMANEIK